jgi:3-deoxy-D-manno-octulosonate 8-phosphate phosphatase (KDO 8-P phosphatase)
VIEVVFFDVDGVLTDGAVYVDADGHETKRISFDDIDAIFELKRAGIKIGFITGEANKFCTYVRERFAPDFFLEGCKDKLTSFRQLITDKAVDPSRVAYVGDSKRDIELLRYVPASFVPADVDASIRKSAKFILRASRGRGVIKEVAEHILQGAAQPRHRRPRRHGVRSRRRG